MGELTARLRPFFVYAGLFSLAINLLLLAPPLYMLQVFDRVISSRSQETLMALTVATIAALGLMAFLDAVRARLLAAAGMALDRRLGPRVLDGLLSRLSGADFANGLRDVATLRGFLTGNGVLALFDAPWLPFFLLIIFLFHPLLGAIALAGAFAMWLLAFVNERLSRGPLERMQGEGRRAGRFIDMSSRNAEVIGALGMLPAVTQRWARLNDAALREQRRASTVGGRFSGLTKFSRQFIQMAMLGAGAWLVLQEHVSAGVMIAATILLGRALAPVEMLVAGWKSLVEARAAWRRLAELLEANPPREPGTELPAPQGRVDVEQVFAKVIKRVSFNLAAGESLGIIGPSASGKSTLARLIVGVWKPASGVVRLDGADVAAWPREQLGPHIGYLPQDVELFAGTVAENIARLGEPDAPEVIRAAQRAHVHEMVLRLPKGYDTEVDEALSPGQRQRIALARALYRAPRLVVLDEPNANLDHDGDQALLRTLAGLKAEGVTVVVIAHRPSLLGGVDKLLVLREGMMDTFGPRADIMARMTRVAA
ncbi:MAG TPA: type I secretion system permease/ATPase [Burkholderiales bacterium]|nr:type I secretion system permease/ATPase [Burkholderiales bacterium]